MKLNLGCCDKRMDGHVNVDCAPGPAVDTVADLERDWPWKTSSVQSIYAHDVIEHLRDKIHTMNEMWRVLVPNGTADILVPTTDGRGAWQDPTHVSYWNEHSFDYFVHGSPARVRFGPFYRDMSGEEVRMRRLIREEISGKPETPSPQERGRPLAAKFRIVRKATRSGGNVVHIHIVLAAVK